MNRTYHQATLICIILILKSPIALTQDLGMSMLQRDQWYAHRNFAIPLPKKNIIALPELSGNALNESGSLNQWLSSAIHGSHTISLQDIWKSLDRKDYLSKVDWNIQTIAFGKKYNRFQWMISHHIQGDLNLIYNKDLLGILAFGNYGYLFAEPLAKTGLLNIKPASDIMVYQSIGADGAYFLNEQNSMSLGIRYVSGLYDLKTDIKKFELDIRDPLSLKANEDWTIRTAHFIDHLSIDSVKLNANTFYGSGNHGISVQAGYSYHTDKFQIGIQLRDLGTIKWKGTQYSRKATTNYSGIRINDILNFDKSAFDHIADSIKGITAIDQSSDTYSTSLHGNVILDGQYDISDQWTLGGAVFYSMGSLRSYWKAMLGVEFKPISILNIAGNISLDRYHHLDMGLTTALKLSIVHLYFSCSPLPAIWNSQAYDHVTGRIGMSLQWEK